MNDSRTPTWQERLAAGVRIDPVTGCHVWTRATQSKGYGVIWIDGRLELTHRAAFRAAHGRPPAPGLVLDHIACDNPPCCNPEHLAEVSNGANIQRAIPRGTPDVEGRRTQWRRSQQAHRSRRAAS